MVVRAITIFRMALITKRAVLVALAVLIVGVLAFRLGKTIYYHV